MIELDMPSASYADRALLPVSSAIYFVADQEAVVYIGQTQNLRRRWGQHHRAAQMTDDHRIYWREVLEGQLDYAEQEAIDKYQPAWNKRAAMDTSGRIAVKLPDLTRQQIQGLIIDLDLDARSVIIRAVHDLWQREIGEGARDLAAEIDQIRAFVGMPDSAAQAAEEKPE